MIGLAGLSLLLQAGTAQIPVQLGVSVTADSVTVGERFIAILRVRFSLWIVFVMRSRLDRRIDFIRLCLLGILFSR